MQGFVDQLPLLLWSKLTAVAKVNDADEFLTATLERKDMKVDQA